MSDESPLFDPAGLAELPDELALGQLPSGRHGLPRSFVVRNQRLRIVAALLRMLPQHGYAGTTIGHITKEAGVSRSAFYGQFSSKEDCFLAAHELAGAWLGERVEHAAAAERQWTGQVRAGVAEALRLLAANPALARLFAIDAIQAGRAARERQRACLARLAKVLRAGRPGRLELPPELEEMLLGGALAMIARYVDVGRSAGLQDATDEVLRYLLIPYLGAQKTNRVVEQAA
jgi:AcrR family transcriptional regulator